MNEAQNFRQRLQRLEEELSLLRAQWDAMQREESGKTAEATPHVEAAIEEPEVMPPLLPAKTVEESSLGRIMREVKHEVKGEGELSAPRAVPEFDPVLSMPPMAVSEDAELRFGQAWAVRIGVVLLLTGFVFLGNYAWEHYISGLPALPRLLLLLTLAVSATIAGEWMRGRERLNRFGQVIAAGGLAAVYYCAFASYHIARLRVIDSPVVGSLVLVATGLGILGYAAWRKSPLLCCAAVMMAFYGTIVQPIALTAMISSLVVSVAATLLCLKHGWRAVGVVGVVSCYFAYVIWQGTVHHALAFSPAAWYLVAYWLLFTVTILHPRAPWSIGQQVGIIAVNHTALAALLSFDWQRWEWHEKTWIVHAILAVVVIGIGFFIERRRGRNMLSESHLLQAFALGTMALLLRWPGETLPLAIAVKGLALMVWCRRDARLVVEGSAYALLMLGFLLATNSWPEMQNWSAKMPLAATYFAALCLAPKGEDLRLAGRWLLAIFGTLVMSLVFTTLSHSQGLLCSSGVALTVAALYRMMGEKFPAPEARHTLLVAAIIMGAAIPIWVIVTNVALLAALSFVVCEKQIEEKTLDVKNSFAILFALTFWLALGVLWVVPLASRVPLSWAPFLAFMMMVCLHAIARMHQSGSAIHLTAPLFVVALCVLADHAGDAECIGLAIAIMAYAAALTTQRYRHILYAVPLVVGYVFFTIHMWNNGPWSSMAFLSLAGAIYLLKFLRRDFLWHWASKLALLFSFLQFALVDQAHEWLTYLSAACFFVLFVMRSRYWNLLPTKKSKWAALVLGVVVAIKLSFWAHKFGPPHALTLLWALLAGVYFMLGFAMRERVMRVLMLALLLCCMGKIFMSVWELGTLMRIASFLVSGAVFLGLGYVYNKHPEWFGVGSKVGAESEDSEVQV